MFLPKPDEATHSVVEHLDIALPLRHFCAVWIQKNRQVRKLWRGDIQRCIEIKVQWEGGEPLLAEKQT